MAKFNHNASRTLNLGRAAYFPFWQRKCIRLIFRVALLSRAPYTAFDVYGLFHLLRAATFAFRVWIINYIVCKTSFKKITSQC